MSTASRMRRAMMYNSSGPRLIRRCASRMPRILYQRGSFTQAHVLYTAKQSAQAPQTTICGSNVLCAKITKCLTVGFFGTFRMRKRVLRLPVQSKCLACAEQDDCFEYDNIFTLTPPRWLARLGFTNGLSGRLSHSSVCGPTIALDAIRSVPDDAKIFDLCEEGDLGGVRDLLSQGEASVKDVDSLGRTPLYVSSIDSFQALFHVSSLMPKKRLISSSIILYVC